MYDELVKALRCCADAACGICPYSEDDRHCGASKLAYDAAAAIEALEAKVADYEDTLKWHQKEFAELRAMIDDANARFEVGKAGNKYTLNEPKRGEWTWIQRANGGQYKGCSVCHAPMPTDSMLDYLDDEDCKFCYSCGANMGVQDG